MTCSIVEHTFLLSKSLTISSGFFGNLGILFLVPLTLCLLLFWLENTKYKVAHRVQVSKIEECMHYTTFLFNAPSFPVRIWKTILVVTYLSLLFYQFTLYTAKCATYDNHMVLNSYDNHMVIIWQSYDIEHMILIW